MRGLSSVVASTEARAAAGIGGSLLRVAVGLEAVVDLQTDLDAA
ncbi:MAG: PLP-dependent transferase [Candidatus Accumulibacter sp.]|nr:PLP-dependent transferase [Accumulibacter sp.]